MTDFFTHSALAAAGVVLLVQQILKLNIVPLAFANRHPVPTNIILSIVATLILVPIHWAFTNVGDLVLQVGTIGVTAAIAYNQLLSRWVALKNSEGPGTANQA